MQQIWDWVGIACFLLLVLEPGILLAGRWRNPARVTWTRFAWAVILGGYGLAVAGAEAFQRANVLELRAMGAAASPEQVELVTYNFLPTMAWYFGITYGPMCAAPWLALYGIAHGVCRWRSGARTAQG